MAVAKRFPLQEREKLQTHSGPLTLSTPSRCLAAYF